jgi:hypothetical protein
VDGPGPLAKKAFINGIAKGREGKVRREGRVREIKLLKKFQERGNNKT